MIYPKLIKNNALVFFMIFFLKLIQINAQVANPIPNKLDVFENLVSEFKKPVDSIWTYIYNYEKDKLQLKEKKLETFTSNGFLLKSIVSYPYNNKWSISEYCMVYNNGKLVGTSRGDWNKEPTSKEVFVLDNNGNIIKNEWYKYSYNSKNQLTLATSDDIMSKDTINYVYDKKGNLSTAILDVFGKLSNKRIATKKLIYYKNKPYAFLDYQKKSIQFYNTRLGSISKENIEPETLWKQVQKDVENANKARNNVISPFDAYHKIFDGYRIVDQVVHGCIQDSWTCQQYLYGGGMEPLGDYSFRLIIYSDGTRVGNIKPDESFLKNLSKSFKTN